MENKTKRASKQRKRFYSAALHEIGDRMSCALSKVLREKEGTRSVPVRAGDKVKVMRGNFKGKSAKVTKVNRYKRQVFIEGITRKKADGTEIQVPFKASNLAIVDLDKGDSRRMRKKGEKAAPSKDAREGAKGAQESAKSEKKKDAEAKKSGAEASSKGEKQETKKK